MSSIPTELRQFFIAVNRSKDMSTDSFSIKHNNLMAEIDSKVFGNKKLLKAEIQAGFFEDVKAIARKIAINLLKEKWKLPNKAKDKDYVNELTKKIVKSFIEHLENTVDYPSFLEHEIKREIPDCEKKLNSITQIPSSAVMFSSMEAYVRKDLWEQDENGVAYLRHLAKGYPKNYIEHYITRPGDITLLPWDEAQQIIDKFGFTTAKLHLVFAAHAMNQEKPWESQFNLKVSDIIQEFGWDKNHKKSKAEKLREIASTAFALDCLLVKAVWVEGRNRKGQIIASAPVGRMWNIYIKPTGQLNLDGEIDNLNDIYITVQPGLWTRDFLNRAGAISREALYQFGYLAQQVLKIDPYHNELALRLAIFLTLDSRVRLNRNYTIQELLEIAFPKPVIAQARQERRKAYDLKQCWDSAIKLLIQLNWQIEFDSATYPEELRPDSTLQNPRGYLDILLNARLTIKPPAPIPELLTTKTNPKPKPKQKSTQSTNLTGSQVRKARTAKGWSQAQLAGFLGVSQKLISLIERGERPINPKLMPKMRKLLEI